ncbi:MAG TPA: creatininase family protein, partial [Vicinamibacterales bacterium]|nr:creatininase family protein [Vicinamibacterales bacterium]
EVPLKKPALLTSLLVFLVLAFVPSRGLWGQTQRPEGLPPTGPAGTAPDTVFLEDLTWAEVRDLIQSGTTTVIIGTAGTEQKGPHMVDGEHKFVMTYAADKIARVLGKTLVAPVITYVPEGNWENPGGHMAKPGTITLPEDRFVELLVSAGRSLKSGGFKTVLFLGESGGNRTGMRTAAARLNELWKGEARAFWADDYYTKSHNDQNKYITDTMGIPADQIGGHANLLDTSEMLFVNPKHVRAKKMAPGGGYQNSGVSGDPSKSTAALGKVFMQIKIDNAVAQLKGLMAGTIEPAGPAAPRGGGAGRAGGAGRGEGTAGGAARGDGRGARGGDAAGEAGGAGRGAGAAADATPPGPRPPTAKSAPAGIAPSQAPDTVFIDELTWEETRDAINAGSTTVIIPTGGTEKNGYHMVLGKHNYVVTHAANLMARRLGKTLVAPTIQYVPEGNPDRQNPGAISLPSPAYDQLLDAAARSLKVHGFTNILFIGDSGGNQAGMTAVANALTQEWKAENVKVHSLTDYYGSGREHYRAWLLAQFGYSDDVIGSHAGISDTSQMMHVRPTGVRKTHVKPWGGPADSGVSGDPAKSTAEIGRMGIEFKINAAIAQFRAAIAPPRGARGGGSAPR